MFPNPRGIAIARMPDDTVDIDFSDRYVLVSKPLFIPIVAVVLVVPLALALIRHSGFRRG